MNVLNLEECKHLSVIRTNFRDLHLDLTYHNDFLISIIAFITIALVNTYTMVELERDMQLDMSRSPDFPPHYYQWS